MLVGIVAGEASGDTLGANLIGALRQRLPQLEFVGVAGPKMQAAGAVTLFPMEKLAVRGYVEVLRHFLELLRIRRSLFDYFRRRRPLLFVGIDAPDFNLGLEAKLKALGITTVQYVGPQVWAWRADRMSFIRNAVDQVLTLFPFEQQLYERADIPVSFVGHPLADLVPLERDQRRARELLGIAPERLCIALLPGSRVSELHYHAATFVACARVIKAKHPQALFLLPLASAKTRAILEATLRGAGLGADASLRLLDGQAQHALTAADVALVASGTATLEAALLKCPMVITYKLSRLSYRIMARKNTLPYVGLPNVLAGEVIVPELLQEQATPERLAALLLELLADADQRARQIERFTRLHQQLRQNNDERIRAALLPYLLAHARPAQGGAQ